MSQEKTIVTVLDSQNRLIDQVDTIEELAKAYGKGYDDYSFIEHQDTGEFPIPWTYKDPITVARNHKIVSFGSCKDIEGRKKLG